MFARTPRLTLRPGWPEDAPALHAAIAHESVVRQLDRALWPCKPEEVAVWLATPRAPGDAVFLIVGHEAGAHRLVGGIRLTAGDDAHDLGYWLTPSAWGRGYATEAACAVIDIARDTLRLGRLTAAHQCDDPASARVLAKLGFRRIDHARGIARERGGLILHDLDLKDVRHAVPLAA